MRRRLTPAIIVSLIILCLAVYGLYRLVDDNIPLPPRVSSSQIPPYRYKEPELFSSGDRSFFNQSKETKRDEGVKAFKEGNYSNAATLFEEAVEINDDDPEVQIYLNNARAHKAGSPFTVAAVVPVGNQLDLAKEILRGVADGQTEFNNNLGLETRLLKIVIANDNDDPITAERVAKELTSNPSILGVIGHSSTNATQNALLVYDKDLAIVSSTSTSTYLSKNNFFRTVPSDEETGKKLAEYTKNIPGLNKVIIFWNSSSGYSKSLREVFAKHFEKDRIKTVVDVNDKKLNLKFEISRAINDGADTALLLLDRDSTAIEIAEANASLPKKQRLRLLGGDALYSPNILQKGIYTKDLVVAVHWFDESQDYATKAKARWGGRVNWVTATSFDATQSLIKSLSKNATRSSILQNLDSLKLDYSETSGNIIDFSQTHSSSKEPVLVQVVKGRGGPKGSQFNYESLK